MTEERVKDNNSGIPDTRVSGGAVIEGQQLGFNVAHPSRARCPEGYYWVSPYYKGTYPFGHNVAGHCRRAGSRDEMEEQILQSNLREKQQKENFRMQEKEAKFQERQAKRKQRAEEGRKL